MAEACLLTDEVRVALRGSWPLLPHSLDLSVGHALFEWHRRHSGD
jgi:hypothetical protein